VVIHPIAEQVLMFVYDEREREVGVATK